MIDQADAGESVRILGHDILDVAVVEFSQVLGEHGTMHTSVLHGCRDHVDGMVFADTTMGVGVDNHAVVPGNNALLKSNAAFLSGNQVLLASQPQYELAGKNQ